MSAVLVQVADAVVDLLNTPDAFSQAFVAKRSYPTWKVPLTKICRLRVDVVPSSHPASELGTQGSTDWTCRLVIVLREKFGQQDRQEENEDGRPISNEAIDELVLLVEEIHDYLCGESARRLENGDLDATWQATTVLGTYNHDHLQDNGQFTGTIQVDYRASEAV